MQNRLLNRFLLTAAGLVLGATLMASAIVATPARAEEHSAGAKAIRVAQPEAEGKMMAPASEATEEGHATEGKKDDVGFPQLKTETYASQLLWLFVSFTLLYVLMSKLALPRVGEVLETRRAQREGNLQRAEELQGETAKSKAAYEAALAKAQESAQEALSAAEQEIADKLSAESSTFTEHARKRIATAEQNIAKAKNDALASLADISAEISVEIVNKVAGVQVNKADAKKVVTDIMKKEAA